MQTLTYGRQKPEDGDKHNVWWDALAANAEKDDAHDHDGSNSKKISISSLIQSQDISKASWVLVSGGLYKQTVTLPAGIVYDDMHVRFLFDGGSYDGDEVFLQVEKVSSTQYDLYINDNTQDLKAKYV